jgi:hypothetical protein
VKKQFGKIEKTVGVLLIASGVTILTGGFQSASLWLIETFPQFGQVGGEVLYQLASGRSTDTTLPEPTRSSSRVTRRAMRRGARVRPPRSSNSTIPVSRSFVSVRDRLDSSR